MTTSEPVGAIPEDGVAHPVQPREHLSTPRDRRDRLLSVDEVAAFLGVPVKTLYQWRHKGTGPKGVRVGRHLRYRPAKIDEWLDRLSA